MTQTLTLSAAEIEAGREALYYATFGESAIRWETLGGGYKVAFRKRTAAVLTAAGAVRKASAQAEAKWREISDQPDFTDRPFRQFIRIEGTRCHSGDINWSRLWICEAMIRRDDPHGYRVEDIERACRDGDIDPWTVRVTHWMPAKFPPSPQAALTEPTP